MDVLALWNRYIDRDRDREFVNCEILDEISGKKIRDKYRKFHLLVGEIISGTNVVLDDVCRRIVHPRHRHQGQQQGQQQGQRQRYSTAIAVSSNSVRAYPPSPSIGSSHDRRSRFFSKIKNFF